MSPLASSARRKSVNPWDRYSWLMAAIWLVFLYYPTSMLTAAPRQTPATVLAGVGIVVFVAAYLLMFRLGGQVGVMGNIPPLRSWLFFGTMILCVLLCIPALGGGVLSFLPFLVTGAAFQFPWRVFLSVAGVSIALALAFALLTGQWSAYGGLLLVILLLSVAMFLTTWLIRRSVDADRLTVELATSEEREAVARDVHDLIGHSLTVVKLKAQLARRLVRSDPDRAVAELEEIERITAEAIGGVRATVTGLRAEGFAAQLDASRTALATAGVVMEVVGEAAMLSPAQAIPAGWVLREATTNVLRHAGAARMRVTVRPGEVLIEDDGAGLSGKPGNGMRGMAERASAAGAVCTIDASALGGVRVGLVW